MELKLRTPASQSPEKLQALNEKDWRRRDFTDDDMVGDDYIQQFPVVADGSQTDGVE